MRERKDIEVLLPQEGELFDVIVVGGGPAGLGAALASALQGAQTLLLEARGFFGGVAAVSHWMPMNRIMLNGGSRGGVHDIFVKKIKQLGPDASTDGRKNRIDADNLDIHPEYLRLAAFELLEEFGCKYRLHSPVIGAVMEANRVKGVKVLTKNGSDVFSAKAFVDASGDGDLAYHAGAKMVKGRESDGAFMAVTLSFVLANVDTARFYAFLESNIEEFRSLLNQMDQEGYTIAKWYGWDMTSVPGFVSVNNGGPKVLDYIDATNSNHLTLSERFGIQVATDFIKIVREKAIPGLEYCALARVGADLGVRETRRIVGDYVMTAEDAIHGIEFEDVVARRYGTIDVAGLAEDKDYHKVSMKNGHAFPYRAMLPVDVEGLVVTGRCGSATHLGQAAGKSMGNMMDLGQAAGIAAALSAKKLILPRQVDVKHIQQVLMDMGVKLFAFE